MWLCCELTLLGKTSETSTHERQMVGREQIEGVDPYKHKPRQKT